MASGFEDWQVPVNISGQDLDEIINRPKYGAAQLSDYSGSISNNTIVTIISISAKGMIYGGFVHADSSSEANQGLIDVVIDGQEVFHLDFEDVLLVRSVENQAHICYLSKYDNVNFIYTLNFSYGITFESSFVVKFTRHAGVDTELFSDVIFATV
jgi:hypothetical protein